jgi:lipopolysaccharide/colanic/teichoic acid biosynthesis glycosyltransferase
VPLHAPRCFPIQFDLYYIKHRSLGLDLHILLRTVRIVLTMAGR